VILRWLNLKIDIVNLNINLSKSRLLSIISINLLLPKQGELLILLVQRFLVLIRWGIEAGSVIYNFCFQLQNLLLIDIHLVCDVGDFSIHLIDVCGVDIHQALVLGWCILQFIDPNQLILNCISQLLFQLADLALQISYIVKSLLLIILKIISQSVKLIDFDLNLWSESLCFTRQLSLEWFNLWFIGIHLHSNFSFTFL